MARVLTATTCSVICTVRGVKAYWAVAKAFELCMWGGLAHALSLLKNE
jgi:hypothetical protein